MKKPELEIGKILLWGGGSQAWILSTMLMEIYNRGPDLVYDYSLPEPRFKTPAMFLNSLTSLIDTLSNDSEFTHFVIAIGGEHGLARTKTSESLIENFQLEPLSLVHPTAYIDPTSKIGVGAQIMPGVIVHKFCTIGKFCVLNTGCSIDHEANIGDGVHIMGAAAIAGRVCVKNYATIGTNSTVLPDIKIGECSYVGAGSTVLNDVPEKIVIAGCPAKYLRENRQQFNLESIRFAVPI